MRKILENVAYHTQRNNKKDPYVTCYSTSIATIIDYILELNWMGKYIIQCPPNCQLDDFVYDQIHNKETKKWIRKNISKFGSWMLNVRPQTIAYVEEYIFNKLMNRYGYECKFKKNQTFWDYCKLIDGTEVPQILHGYFKPETKIKGHVIVGVGYDTEKRTFIVHDPFGNAKTKYKNTNGKFVEYPCNHWFYKKSNAMWITTINKI